MIFISRMFFPEDSKVRLKGSIVKQNQKDLIRSHPFLRRAWVFLYGSTVIISSINSFFLTDYSLSKTLLFFLFLSLAAALNYFCYFERFFADSYVIRTTKRDPVFILGKFVDLDQKQKYKKNMTSLYAMVGGSLLFSIGSTIGATSGDHPPYLAGMIVIAVYPQLLWFCICTSIVYMIRKETQFMTTGGLYSCFIISLACIQFCYFAWLQRYCLERLNLDDSQRISTRPMLSFVAQLLVLGSAVWLVTSTVMPAAKINKQGMNFIKTLSNQKADGEQSKNPDESQKNKSQTNKQKESSKNQDFQEKKIQGSASDRQSQGDGSGGVDPSHILKWMLGLIGGFSLFYIMRKFSKKNSKNSREFKSKKYRPSKKSYQRKEREVVVRQVLEKYHYFEHALESRNHKRPIDKSPEEFLNKINSLFRISDLDQILEVYNNAMYGNQAPERLEFKKYKNQINRAIGQVKRV